MPDLNQPVVITWLNELRADPAPPAWPPAIRAAETQAGMPQALTEMGFALDTLAAADLRVLSAGLREAPLRDDLSAAMAQLGAARVLRILHWLAEQDVPDCHDVTAALLQGDGQAAQALRANVQAVIRRTTLRCIFAPERIAALEFACTANLEDAQ